MRVCIDFEFSYNNWHQLFQISEVVSSMKDLIDFCHEQKFGPIGNFLLLVFHVSIHSSMLTFVDSYLCLVSPGLYEICKLH